MVRPRVQTQCLFNLCVKKSLHFKLNISLIINLLDLYDKIRLCSGDYSHSDKQNSEIVVHTEEGGTLGSHLLYIKLQLARGIPWQKCTSQYEQCSQLIWEGYHFLLPPHRPQGKPAEALSPASSPGVYKEYTPGSRRRGLSSVCLVSWQLFHVQWHQAGWAEKNRDPGRKEHTRLRPEDMAQRPNPTARSLKSFGQVYLSLLSIAMINHSDQKRSGKEKAYLADAFWRQALTEVGQGRNTSQEPEVGTETETVGGCSLLASLSRYAQTVSMYN